MSTKKKSFPSRAIRTTLRMVANHLGISSSTVSLALRNSPSIPEKTRSRVVRGAKSLGYRPDPQISKLMSHLRAGWKPKFKSSIYALTTRTRFSEYHTDILKGAKLRAEELGYGFTLKRFDPKKINTRNLQHALITGGIEGILLLPMATSISCEKLLDWNHFSVVSATYGVRSPEFHRVVPHQFSNVRLACAELANLGYRRIGLIQQFEFSAVVNHSFLAAVTTLNHLSPAHSVTPFLFADKLLKGIKKWFLEQRPDALVVEGEPTYQIVARELELDSNEPLGVALANRERSSRLAGIDEHGSLVGRTAIDVLAFKIQTGDRGVPAEPVVTMIEGTWIPGKSR